MARKPLLTGAARRCGQVGGRRIEFALDAPVDVMVDGEVLTLDCRSVKVLPGVLDVLI